MIRKLNYPILFFLFGIRSFEKKKKKNHLSRNFINMENLVSRKLE